MSDSATPFHRTLLVTGASSGIGQAISRRLLKEGHTVLGIARDFTKFEADSPRFLPFAMDLAELDHLPTHLQQITRDHPDIDAVICNAGRGQFGSLEEFSYDQIRSLAELNFISQAFVARAFLPAMKRRGEGDLIFMGSEAAISGGGKGAIYSATKFALRGLAQGLREECAKSGIRVCIINPGMVRTPFFDKLHFEPGELGENHLLPEDIAEAVSMVLSAREGTVFDELNLSPLKKVIRFRKD